MTLPEFCIKRPVFTCAVTFIMIIIGIIAYERLQVRNLPDISNPMVVVRTVYAGADAKLIETRITTPLEEAISGVTGIDYMKSRSDQGVSRISIFFKPGYDINLAISDVRDKINTVSIPPDVSQPTIGKANDDDDPAIVLSVTSTNLTPMQITDYVTRYVSPSLQQQEGVSNVDIWGARDYAMLVSLNPTLMVAHGTTVNDILSSLDSQNIYVPGGMLKNFSRYYPITAEANLYTAQDFRNVVVRSNSNYITRLGDVSNIKVGPENIDSLYRINGKSAVGIAIIPDSNANPIDVAQEVQEALTKLQANLPESLNINVLYDNSQFIKASLNEVYRAIIEALVLVTVVIFLFLGSWRATLVPIVTIPICLVATFAILYAFNYSINTITLLAFVLAIGLVVDDAIVMLENIHRHIEEGISPFKSAMLGSKEILFAIIAMTLTLVAVYLPIGFTPGVTGILFSQFAVTLAGAVLISGFVALTLSPMMSARVLNPHQSGGRYLAWLEKTMHGLTQGYKSLLSKTLQHRFWVVLALALIAGIGYWLYRSLPSELSPTEDQGYIIGILNAPSQSSIAYTDHYTKMVENIYKQNPDIKNYFVFVGNGGDTTQVYSTILLKPIAERKKSQSQITQDLRQKMAEIPGVNAFPVVPAPLGQYNSSHTGVSVNIISAESLERTIAIADNYIEVIKKYPGLINVMNQTTIDTSAVNLIIDRNKAADLQVSVNDIANTIATLYGGSSDNQHFQYDGQEYDVIVQLPDKDLRTLSQLDNIQIRSQTGKMIPLSSVAKVNLQTEAQEFPHYNRLRVAMVTADLAPGYSMGDVAAYLQSIGKKALPNNAQYAFSGALRQFLMTRSDITGMFVFALVFIYLVLAAQFESIIDPFVVLLSVPLSMFGGLVFLKLTGMSLNIFSEIGMITLIGLVSKHGILITEFANKEVAKGKALIPAIVDASALRLRPILMTTGAMVLGAVPLAIATGAGSESRQAIGWVIVGGMLLGTFFSLFVVPVAYSYLSGLKRSHSLDYEE